MKKSLTFRNTWQISLRILRVFLLAAIIIVLAQDVMIFPGIVRSWFSTKTPDTGVPREVEQLFVQTKDLEKIDVWRLPPSKANIQPYSVIIFHGNGGSISNFFPIQKWFSQIGITSYGFDYRGFGHSSGWPSEKGFAHDAEAVWNYVIEREKTVPEKIIMFGISIGTGPAAAMAAKKQPGALLLFAPFTSLADVVRDRLLLGVLSPFLWYQFPTSKNVAQLKETCLLIFHGEEDTIISPHLSEGIKQSYHGNNFAKRYLVPKAHHNDLFYKAKPLLAEELRHCFIP